MTIRIPRTYPENWDFGITHAKKFPPYVFSDNGMGCLIHKVLSVDIHWWEYEYQWLVRRDAPMMIARTICGMSKRLEVGRMKSSLCAVPKADAVLCGKCHGLPANFPRKDPKSKEQRLAAKASLGCMAEISVTHPPIICRRCGLRIPDIHEPEFSSNVCHCPSEDSTLCTSTEQPPNLDFYDKYSK